MKAKSRSLILPGQGNFMRRDARNENHLPLFRRRSGNKSNGAVTFGLLQRHAPSIFHFKALHR
jgi:hypothetical protein